MKTRVRWNRHTLAFAAVVIAMWYAAEAQSNGAAHLLALLSACLGGLSWLHARANIRNLEVRLTGGTAHGGTVTLQASRAAPSCGLEVYVDGTEKPAFIEIVTANHAVTVRLPPPKHSATGGVRIYLRSLYPLGLFTAEAAVQTAWSYRAHPKPAGDLPLPKTTTGLHAQISNTTRSLAKGSDGDFAGLREWRAGDSLRRIDWRHTARGNALMVKEWSTDAADAVVLNWDQLTNTAAETRASQIARWIEQCERDGLLYELRLPQTVIPAGFGTAHRRRCLNALSTQMEDASGNAPTPGGLMPIQSSHGNGFENSAKLQPRPLLFLCMVLLLAAWPLYGYVPTSSLIICALCLLWRGVLRGGVPPIAVRTGVLVVGFIGVWAHYGQLHGMEPGIALLLVLSGAKALESRTPREFQVLALLGWFLAFCAVLLESHLARSLWALTGLLAIAGCMVRFRRSTAGTRAPLRVTLTLLVQALPLTLVLFFIFPRGLLDLSAALGRSRTAQTGIDGMLDPGSLARVAMRTEVAFRARFPGGEAPQNADRYWRCLTLWHCEGLRWTRGAWLARTSKERPPESERDVRQIIDLEPHGQMWIPALDRPLSGTKRGTRLTIEFDDTLITPDPVVSSQRLEVVSRFPQPQTPVLPPDHRAAALQLPTKISPELRRLTDHWRTLARNDEQIVQAALQYLRTQGFSYTLEPGEYHGDTALEEFFLHRRTGFCEHFSASFATLMRMSGIPARIVVGYLGGEYSDHNGGYLIVKQSDVHAWTEVWLERLGWFRVDPTAELAPDRVNVDLRWFFSGGAAEMERQRRSLWGRFAQSTRLLWDGISYAWQNQIIDYNQESQRGLLLLLGLQQNQLLLLVPSALAVMLAAGIMTWWLRRPARHADPWARSWLKLCQKLATSGLPQRPLHEGPMAYAERVSAARPELADDMQQLAALYAQGRYGNAPDGLHAFKQRVASWHPAHRTSESPHSVRE